jgi:hypothetical protein
MTSSLLQRPPGSSLLKFEQFLFLAKKSLFLATYPSQRLSTVDI